jgi:hypothetical protein
LSSSPGPSRAERIVALLAPGSSAPEVPDWAEVLVTASGYEAAAELLAAPAAALVLDLGRITDAHRPLLTLAAGMKIPVVAFGTVRAVMDGERLAGLHLATRASAADVLASVLGDGPGEGRKEPAGAGLPLAPLQGEYRPAEAEGPSAKAEPAPPRPERPPPKPGRPLTDDELKALLGDDL